MLGIYTIVIKNKQKYFSNNNYYEVDNVSIYCNISGRKLVGVK